MLPPPTKKILGLMLRVFILFGQDAIVGIFKILTSHFDRFGNYSLNMELERRLIQARVTNGNLVNRTHLRYIAKLIAGFYNRFWIWIYRHKGL